jgi:hypothetical protein
MLANGDGGMEDQDVEKVLGTVMVTSSGDGLHGGGRRKTFPVTVSVFVDGETVRRDEDGKVVSAYCVFSAKFDVRHWDPGAEGGHPYTDKGVERGMNDFLASLGFDGWVGWSEMGRQEHGVADFDMDYALIDQFFPDLKDKAVAGPRP